MPNKLNSRQNIPFLTRDPVQGGEVCVSLSKHLTERLTNRAGGQLRFATPWDTRTVKIVRGGQSEVTWIIPAEDANRNQLFLLGSWCGSQSGMYDNVFKAATVVTGEQLNVVGFKVLDTVSVKLVASFSVKGKEYYVAN